MVFYLFRGIFVYRLSCLPLHLPNIRLAGGDAEAAPETFSGVVERLAAVHLYRAEHAARSAFPAADAFS